MKRVTVHATIALVMTATLASPADTLVEFRAPQGASWRVDQEVGLRQDVMALGAVAGVGEGGEAWLLLRLSESFVDEVIEDRDGRPTKLRRKYDVSKADLDEGDCVDTSVAGSSLVLGGDGCDSEVVPEQGSPDNDLIQFLARAPVEPVLAILPKGQVKEGYQWEVGATELAAFRRGIYADAVGAVDDRAAGEIARTLDLLSNVRLVGKVSSVSADEVVIEYTGGSRVGTDRALEFGGIRIEGTPRASVEMEGTLTFSTTAGRPSRLEWKERRSVTAAGRLSVPGLGTVGGAGARQDWRVTRTYSSTE